METVIAFAFVVWLVWLLMGSAQALIFDGIGAFAMFIIDYALKTGAFIVLACCAVLVVSAIYAFVKTLGRK